MDGESCHTISQWPGNDPVHFNCQWQGMVVLWLVIVIPVFCSLYLTPHLSSQNQGPIILVYLTWLHLFRKLCTVESGLNSVCFELIIFCIHNYYNCTYLCYFCYLIKNTDRTERAGSSGNLPGSILKLGCNCFEIHYYPVIRNVFSGILTVLNRLQINGY